MNIYKCFFLTILLLNYLAGNAQNDNEDCSFVVYTDSTLNLSTRNFVNRNRGISPLPNPTLTSRKGKFIVSYDDNYFMTEGVKHCLKLAMDNWEDKINILKPVQFYVCVSEELDMEIALKTTVGYVRSNGIAYADNLINQTMQNDVSIKDSVCVNALVDWNTSWSYDDGYDGTVNLTNGFMRSIARILGFGCSIVNRSGSVNFALNRSPSEFDKLVFNGDTRLSDLAMSRPGLVEQFFQGDTQLRFDSQVYDLYDVGSFVSGKSGLYFSLGFDNLMEFTLNDQMETQSLNQETLNVIRKIGWDISDVDNEIICDSTNALGYGSIYRNYNFSLKNCPCDDMNDIQWIYQIYNNDVNDYETIYSESDLQFCVQPTVVEGSFDDFVCHQARVLAKVNSKEYSFPLNLETRPLIESVDILSITPTDSQHCSVSISIKQRGAACGTILVSDDSGAVHEYNYTGGVITVSSIYRGQNIYVDVTLENSYGSSNKFIVETPYLPLQDSVTSRVGKSKTEASVSPAESLRDSDIVTFNLPHEVEGADSVCWFIDIGGMMKRIYPDNTNGSTYTYKITLDSLDIKIEKLFNTDLISYYGGKSWGRYVSWKSDGYCRFRCYVYKYSGENVLKKLFSSNNYLLDVLPSIPTLEILKVWIEEEDNYWKDWINVLLRTNVTNARTLSVQVAQSDYFGIEYTDTFITEGIDDAFKIRICLPEDQINCIAYNDYGFIQGPNVKVIPTDINDYAIIKNNSYITVEGNNISVTTNNNSVVRIYSYTGEIISTINNVTPNSVQLPNGVYIINLFDPKTKKSVTKKIKIN